MDEAQVKELAAVSCIKAWSAVEVKGEVDALACEMLRRGDVEGGLARLGWYLSSELSDGRVAEVAWGLRERVGRCVSWAGLRWLLARYRTHVLTTRYLRMVKRELRMAYGRVAIWEAGQRYLLSYGASFGTYLNYHLMQINWRARDKQIGRDGGSEEMEREVLGVIVAEPEEQLRQMWLMSDDPISAHQAWLRRVRGESG